MTEPRRIANSVVVAVHEPSKHKSKAELAKLGYPAPIVEHAKARKRALARYKNPGDEADE